jgi:hypothetical protein
MSYKSPDFLFKTCLVNCQGVANGVTRPYDLSDILKGNSAFWVRHQSGYDRIHTKAGLRYMIAAKGGGADWKILAIEIKGDIGSIVI